jgi:hypothetical protein
MCTYTVLQRLINTLQNAIMNQTDATQHHECTYPAHIRSTARNLFLILQCSIHTCT